MCFFIVQLRLQDHQVSAWFDHSSCSQSGQLQRFSVRSSSSPCSPLKRELLEFWEFRDTKRGSLIRSLIWKAMAWNGLFFFLRKGVPSLFQPVAQPASHDSDEERGSVEQNRSDPEVWCHDNRVERRDSSHRNKKSVIIYLFMTSFLEHKRYFKKIINYDRIFTFGWSIPLRFSGDCKAEIWYVLSCFFMDICV